MLKLNAVDLLFVLLVNVGTFTQQQLSHLLPLGMGGSHSTVLKNTSTSDYHNAIFTCQLRTNVLVEAS